MNARAAQRREIGGVERVTRELATRLPALRPDRYTVIAPPPRLAHRAGHLWEQAVLPAASAGARLIFSPANLAPVASRRNVVLIHDVAALRNPQWYGRTYAHYQRLLLPLIARRARQVITVSEFSRRELAEVLGLDRERIAVVSPGVDERFGAASAGSPPVGLTRPYVLTLGTRIARKNLAALTETATLLAEHGIDLVAAGSGRGYMRAETGTAVTDIGYVDDDKLPALYTGARAFVLPSLYEGFGIPCLEAMAAGTPVVAADGGALPGTCGDAALLVDPADKTALADAVLAAASDDAVRGRLLAAGRKRAARFSWERTAEAADAVIGATLGR